MRKAEHGRVSAVAFFAACVLVLQSFLSAWSAAAMPATPLLDAFGNALCITSVDHGGPGPSNDHGKLPNCCTVGCTAQPLVADTLDRSDGLSRQPSSAGILFERYGAFYIHGSEYTPGNPRAPPLTA